MLPTKDNWANIYNPLNQDKNILLDTFVVRTIEFNKVFRELKRSRLNQSSQNFIIQGQRGAGKTTLLAKIRYEIEDNPDLSHLLPVQFAEEQYNIFSLNRLWLSLADYLDETKGFETLIDEMEGYEDNEDLFLFIEKALKKNRKKLVLLIDNFGDLLNKFKENEHKKLRDILHESNLQIIAASTKTLEITYRHDKPFFEAFKTITLKPLSKEDVLKFLESLSKKSGNYKNIDLIRSQTDKIEAIRRLGGGMPRTILFLYEIIQDPTGSVFDYLEAILDKTTPLYQHKMESLSTYQKAIMDALALNWDGMLASEISKKINMETKAVSAHLKNLEKSQVVTSAYLNKREKVYFIEERFFNIWYLMRYGRKKNKNRVKWLVSFLNNWCTKDELLNRVNKHFELSNSGQLNTRGEDIMTEAFSQTIEQPQLKNKIFSTTPNDIQFVRENVATFKSLNNHLDFKNSFSSALSAVNKEDYKNSIIYFNNFLDCIPSYEKYQNLITKYLILLLSKKQYHLVYKLLNESTHNLKEILKPLYYALLQLMEDEHPKELKRMGPELNETVEEILQEVKRLQE